MYHRLHAAIRASHYVLEPRVVVPWRVKMMDAAALLPPGALVRVLSAELLLRIVGVMADWGLTAAGLLCTWAASELLEVAGPISYSRFHALWTIPALAALAICNAVSRRGRGVAYQGLTSDFALMPKWIALLSLAALLYTLPWDSFLIQRGVWSSARVSGTLAHVPLEEVAFFILATLISCGTWLLVWPERWIDPAAAGHGLCGWSCVTLALIASWSGGALAVAAAERTFYLGMLLLWSTPILLLQWVVGGHILAAHAAPLARATLLAGGGLALADRWAIRRNVWVINPELSLWPWAPGLHVEEVLFFFLTSTMCLWGLTLALWADLRFTPSLRVAAYPLARRLLGGGQEAQADTRGMHRRKTRLRGTEGVRVARNASD